MPKKKRMFGEGEKKDIKVKKEKPYTGKEVRK